MQSKRNRSLFRNKVVSKLSNLTGVPQYELAHQNLQELISPKWALNKRKLKPHSQKIERAWFGPTFIAGTRKQTTKEIMRTISKLDALLLTASLPVPIVHYPVFIYLAAKYYPEVMRYSEANKMVKRHGEDALLLMWANPPRELNALRITAWETEMVMNGFLKKEGGMTNNGKKLFKQFINSQELFSRIKKAEKEMPSGLIREIKLKELERINKQRARRGLAPITYEQLAIQKN